MVQNPHFLKYDVDQRIGYARFHVRVSPGEMKAIMAHQLIAETFISDSHFGLEINHKNGMKLDNRPENLEWVTHKQNQNEPLFLEKQRTSQKKRQQKVKAEEQYITDRNLWSDFKEWRSKDGVKF